MSLVVARLAELIAAVDAADAACPIRSGKGGQRICPKCGATSSQPCGPVISAEYDMVKECREIVAAVSATETQGDAA